MIKVVFILTFVVKRKVHQCSPFNYSLFEYQQLLYLIESEHFSPQAKKGAKFCVYVKNKLNWPFQTQYGNNVQLFNEQRTRVLVQNITTTIPPYFEIFNLSFSI
jgi:hypothetical protein